MSATPSHLPTPLLSARGVTIEYKTPDRLVRATHQVSFDVLPQDRFILLGPSGFAGQIRSGQSAKQDVCEARPGRPAKSAIWP